MARSIFVPDAALVVAPRRSFSPTVSPPPPPAPSPPPKDQPGYTAAVRAVPGVLLAVRSASNSRNTWVLIRDPSVRAAIEAIPRPRNRRVFRLTPAEVLDLDARRAECERIAAARTPEERAAWIVKREATPIHERYTWLICPPRLLVEAARKAIECRSTE